MLLAPDLHRTDLRLWAPRMPAEDTPLPFSPASARRTDASRHLGKRHVQPGDIEEVEVIRDGMEKRRDTKGGKSGPNAAPECHEFLGAGYSPKASHRAPDPLE